MRVDLARLGDRAEVARRLRQAVERDEKLLARRYPYLPQAATVWEWLDTGKPVGWPGHSLRDLAKYVRDQTGKPCDSEAWVQPPPAAFQVCGAPRRPSLSFRGRDHELEEIMQRLRSGMNACVCAAIEGLPGIGKTELALHVAHAFAAEALDKRSAPAFPRGIFWFNAENRDLTAAWDEVARRFLDIAGESMQQRVNEVIRLLERAAEPCLIVLDNAFLRPDERWEEGRGKPFPLPCGSQVRLLVTTRNDHFARMAFQHTRLDVLPAPVARQLLLEISERDATGDPARLDGLDELLEQLGGHALALEVSGAYLQRNGSETPHSLLRRIQQGERLERQARQTGYAVAKADYEATIQGAFLALWNLLDAETQRHWQLAAQFEPAPVSVALSEASGLSIDALAALQEFHLVEWAPSGNHWVMHRLTRAFARTHGPAETAEQARKAFVVGCATQALRTSPELTLAVYIEDRAHFDAALAMAADVVDSEVELTLTLAIGPALITHLGYTDEQAHRLCTRALEAAERSGSHERVFLALFGLLTNYILRGGWREGACALARLEAFARSTNCSDHWFAFFVGSGVACYYTGRPREALSWFDKGLGIVGQASHSRWRTSFDPLVSLMAHAGYAECIVGCPERALELCGRAVARAVELQDPATLCMAWTIRAGLHQFRSELDLCEDYAGRAYDLALIHGPEFSEYFAAIFRGWARAARAGGGTEAGLQELRENLSKLARLNFGAIRGFVTVLAIDAHHRSGQREQALALCDEAESIKARFGEGFAEPELWRFRAQLADSPVEARRSLNHAVELASERGARWWELRARTDLVEATDAASEEGQSARERLRELCATFTEGLALLDVRRAQALLR
ncbi:MAG: ATP-binding protein [Deltaproteobacteria bacterium]